MTRLLTWLDVLYDRLALTIIMTTIFYIIFLVGPLLFNELIDVTVISHTGTDGGTDGGQIEKYLSNKRYKITWKAGLIRDARCRNLLLKWELLYIDRMLKSSIHIYYQWPRS